jgi:hypothetical protein
MRIGFVCTISIKGARWWTNIESTSVVSSIRHRKYYTPLQNKKVWYAQIGNITTVNEITRILMYVLTPREFGFQGKLHLQFSPFWIEIWLLFRECSMKFGHAHRYSTLMNRYSLLHFRFDWYIYTHLKGFLASFSMVCLAFRSYLYFLKVSLKCRKNL